MIILGADGHLIDRVTEPMTVQQVRWFCDPVEFLQNVPHLWSLHLRVFCLRCWKRGLKDDVRVRWDDTNGVFFMSCACAKVDARLSPQNVTHYASSTDELLGKLGWSLCCTGRCAKESGMADGVEAHNDSMASALTITCGCTERRYVMPEPAGRPS